MVVPDLDRTRWFTSTRSNNGGNCVEVAFLRGGRVAVRDSKNRYGPSLVFTAGQWAAFVRSVRAGRFDRPVVDRCREPAQGT